MPELYYWTHWTGLRQVYTLGANVCCAMVLWRVMGVAGRIIINPIDPAHSVVGRSAGFDELNKILHSRVIAIVASRRIATSRPLATAAAVAPNANELGRGRDFVAFFVLPARTIRFPTLPCLSFPLRSRKGGVYLTR